MTILKIIFTLLLCVPLIYLVIFFLVRLMDEVIAQDQRKTRESDRRRRRNQR